jgi:hypothetical protein
MDRYFGAMALPRILLALGWCVLMHGHACAHSDPAGDTSPMIDVADEKFIVTFRTRLPNQGARDEYVYSRIIYSPDGKILVPRHRLEKWPDEVYLSNPDRRDREDRRAVVQMGREWRFPSPWLLSKMPVSKVKISRDLLLDSHGRTGQASRDFLITSFSNFTSPMLMSKAATVAAVSVLESQRPSRAS